MATIAELVVAGSVDPSGIKRGFDQALGFAQQFARAVDHEFEALGNSSAGKGKQSGAVWADALIAEATREFDSAKSRLREQMFSGALSPQSFRDQGRVAAAAYNQTLLAGLRQLRQDRTIGTLDEQRIVASMRDEGLKAGRAYSQGVQQGASSGGASGGGWPGRGPGFQVMGRNAAPAVVATAYGFESLARSATAAEGAVRAATRSVATFAAGFGTGGIIVSGVIAASEALADFWMRQRREAEETRKKLMEEIGSMANAGQSTELQNKFKELMFGTPFNAKGELQQASKLVSGAFEGSLADLEARFAKMNRELPKGATMAAGDIAREYNKVVAALDDARAKAQQLRQAIANVQDQSRRGGGLLAAMTTSAGKPQTTSQSIGGLEGTASQIEQTRAAMVKLGLDTSGLGGEIEKVWLSANSMLQEHTELLDKDRMRLMEIMARMMELRSLTVQQQQAFAQIAARGVPGVQFMGPSMARPTAAAMPLGSIDRAIAAQQAARAASLSGAGNAAALESEANRQREKAVALIRAEMEAMTGVGTLDQEHVQRLETLNKLLQALAGTQDTSASQFREIAAGIHGVLDAADGFGLLNADLKQTVNGVLHAIEAVKALRDAQKAAQTGGGGGILGTLGTVGAAMGVAGGVVAAVGGFVSMFKGESSALQATLRENSERLRELRANMGLNGGVGESRAALQALQGFRGTAVGAAAGSNPLLDAMMRGQQEKMLAQMASSVGLSMDQLAEIVKRTGLKLFDENGHLLAGAVSDVMEALKLSAEAAARLTESFDDQRMLRDLHDRVFGKTSDADALRRSMDLLKQFAPALAGGFEGLDAATAEGRERIQEALRQLVTMIESNTLTPEQLGKFTDIKQLIDTILGVQGALDALGKTTNAVTQAIVNVPSWYKVASAEWRAADARAAMRRPAPTGGATFGAGAAGAGAEVTRSRSGAAYNFSGDIYVDAREQSPEDIFAAMLRVAKRKASLTFNDSTRWSEVQN